jgi:hypothetical protein
MKKLTKKTKQKLEALIRFDIEGMPYKYRELHEMFFGGIPAYKDFDKEEIDEMFRDYELKITEEDKEWAKYNNY